MNLLAGSTWGSSDNESPKGERSDQTQGPCDNNPSNVLDAAKHPVGGHRGVDGGDAREAQQVAGGESHPGSLTPFKAVDSCQVAASGLACGPAGWFALEFGPPPNRPTSTPPSMSDAVAEAATPASVDSHPSSDETLLGLAADAPETESLPLECEETHENESSNFVWLALHQVLMRVGWVFKTESIVMPFFMDAIGGGPVLRGSLMVFNRLGFSVPPALFARSLKLMPQKRKAVGLATAGMAIPFAVLSVLWASGWWRGADGEPAVWMPYFFLAAYGLFFTLTGINQLSLHSINGKLIRPERRGALFAAGVFVGSPIAIACAWFLMPRWLALPDGGFTWLFAAPAVCFLLAGVTQLAVREKPDDFNEPAASPWRRIWEAMHLAFTTPVCRGVAIVATLFSADLHALPALSGARPRDRGRRVRHQLADEVDDHPARGGGFLELADRPDR